MHINQTPAEAFQKCFDYEVNSETNYRRILAKASKDAIFKAWLFIHNLNITPREITTDTVAI